MKTSKKFVQCIPLLAILILFAGKIVAQEKSFERSKESPVIDTDPKELDFGEILVGQIHTKKMKIYNKGKSDLTLMKIGFTCGCTIPQIILPSGEMKILDRKGDKMIGVLNPGEVAVLDLEYRGSYPAGDVHKSITLHSDDPEKRNYKVPVLAKIQTAFTFEPRWLDFGQVQKGQTTSRSTIIRSVRAGDFEITGVANLPPFLTYTVEKLKDSKEPSTRLTLMLKEDAPVGSSNWKVKLNVDSEKIEVCEVYSHLRVLSPVTFANGTTGNDDRLSFGVLPRGKGAVRTIEIVNKIPAVPYKIANMSFQTNYTDFIEARLITENEGVHYKILVTVKPETDCRYFKGVITLTSGHPDLPKKEISVKGWIRT